MSPAPPPLRPFSRGDVRAQTGSEASAFDARAIRDVGVPQPVLMENAGRSAALVIESLYAPERVIGIAGSGNNGGDALVVLRTFAAWGREATAVLVSDRPADDPLLHGWPVTVVRDTDLDPGAWTRLLAGADVVVDGILGTGVQGAARERQADAIDRMNSGAAPIVALDVPSGVDASSGAVPGAAVDAALTVSFGAPKTGALVHPARARVGRHVTVEIGFPPISDPDASAHVVTPDWARARLPVRGSDTHKNRVGRVLLVGGGAGMAGAIILAARAAFRAGAGLVRVCSVPENRDAIQAAVPEAIFVPLDDERALLDACAASDAIGAGPGLGTGEPEAEALARVAASGAAPLLLDADALNLVAEGRQSLTDIAERRPTLITPHPGEMARLRGASFDGSDDPSESRLDVVRSFARASGTTVLFKGAPSVVASPEGPVLIDTQSSSDLAVAGMGDTLAGVCAALMAQKLEPAVAGAVGLYLSGRAAALAGQGAGLTPSDVVEYLPAAATEDGPARTDLTLPFVIFDADPAR